MDESTLNPAWMESSAAAIGLPIAAERVAGLRAHLERIAEMAAPLLARSIPDAIESAQVFEAGFAELNLSESGVLKSGVREP